MPPGYLSTDEVVEVLRARDRNEYPVVTATYVADHADVSRVTARDRLHDALDEGKVEKSTISQAGVWWPTEERMSSGEADPDKVAERPSNATEDSNDDLVTDGAVASSSQMSEGVDKLLQSNHDMMEEISALRSDLKTRQEQIEDLREQREKLRKESRSLQEERQQLREERKAQSKKIKKSQLGVVISVVGLVLGIANAYVSLPSSVQAFGGLLILAGIGYSAYVLNSVDTNVHPEEAYASSERITENDVE